MRIVTVTSRSYLIGTLVLLKSIGENGNLKCPVTVVSLDQLTNLEKDRIKSLVSDVDFFNIQELGVFNFKTEIISSRRTINLNKLLVLTLPYTQTCVMLDSDMLCLKDASEILRIKPYAACMNFGHLANMRGALNGRLPFNSGLLVFRPSLEEFNRIQQFADKFYKDFTRIEHIADQHIWNAYIHHSEIPITMLGMEFNVTDTLKNSHKNLYAQIEKKTIFYHFTWEKPWNSSHRLTNEQRIWNRFAESLS